MRPSTTAAVVVMTAALLVVLPFAFFGSPSGHDFEFHLSSWMETVSQWKQAIAFPRWADLAHFGYGEPRFVFYPPLSWLLGAALGAMFPWAAVPAIFVWVVLSLGGWCMFWLAREWLPEPDAIAAATLYTVNPYHIVAIYWRSSYAELFADALFPLLLLWILRGRENPRRAVAPLSLTLAVIWLSNAPAAVIATYLVAGSAILICLLNWKWRLLPYPCLAIVLALGLAAFYILPAAWEQKWVNIGQVLSPGVRPGDNFLFTTIADPEHNIFNLLVSLVAAAEIAIVAITAVALARWRKERCDLWWMLVLWGTVSALLMFRITDPLWEHLPKLKFVQLPWRWLVPLNVAFVLLVVGAIRRTVSRVIFLAMILLAMLTLSNRVLAPWWDQPQDIRALHQAVATAAGYEGTDEYVPLGGDAYEIKPDAPRVEVRSEDGESSAIGTISHLRWSPEVKNFTVNVRQPSQLVLRVFNYPAWRAQVNGQPVSIATRDVTGQMVIAVPAGQSRMVLRFTRTPDRTVGSVISIVFAVIVFLMVAVPAHQRRRTPPMKRIFIASSNRGKLRDFAGAAQGTIEVLPVPEFSSLPLVEEDGATFEENARKKAEYYSRAVPGDFVLADDSGLEVDALSGAPGVHSARYATPDKSENASDAANNARLLRELADVPEEKRTARFVCLIAVAQNGNVLATFRGGAKGRILWEPRGTGGFGYDPLFYFPNLKKTFAELSPEEKAKVSHRGHAFREFIAWIKKQP